MVVYAETINVYKINVSENYEYMKIPIVNVFLWYSSKVTQTETGSQTIDTGPSVLCLF